MCYAFGHDRTYEVRREIQKNAEVLKDFEIVKISKSESQETKAEKEID